MKHITKALTLVVSLATMSAAYATTAVYQDGDFLRASINDVQDARILYDTLALPEVGGRSGTSKSYATSDGKVDVFCSKSSIPVGIPYGCMIAIRTTGASGATVIYRDGDAIRASLNSPEDAGALFEALEGGPTRAGRSGWARSYGTSDEKVEVHCTKSRIPGRVPYGCSISIALK